jgi:hypothetical protein
LRKQRRSVRPVVSIVSLLRGEGVTDPVVISLSRHRIVESDPSFQAVYQLAFSVFLLCDYSPK